MYVKPGHGFQIAGHIDIEGQETMLHSAASAVQQSHRKGAVRVRQPTRRAVVRALHQECYAPAEVESDVNVQAMDPLADDRPTLYETDIGEGGPWGTGEEEQQQVQRKSGDQKQCIRSKVKPPILLVTTPDGTLHDVFTNNGIRNY